jgi:hypothetical protein
MRAAFVMQSLCRDGCEPDQVWGVRFAGGWAVGSGSLRGWRALEGLPTLLHYIHQTNLCKPVSQAFKSLAAKSHLHCTSPPHYTHLCPFNISHAVNVLQIRCRCVDTPSILARPTSKRKARTGFWIRASILQLLDGTSLYPKSIRLDLEPPRHGLVL